MIGAILLGCTRILTVVRNLIFHWTENCAMVNLVNDISHMEIMISVVPRSDFFMI